MNGWIHLAATVLLAIYGWWLITQLAKRREAYDLYCSIISLLEQIEADGIMIWTGRLDNLDEYTERKLTLKVEAVEQRLQVIQQYYRFRRNHRDTIIDSNRLADLRSYLTKPYDLEPNVRARHTRIHDLTTTMITDLLTASYDDINKRSWLPF